jgi:benzoyl-CoA reductase/2-hydroxyglutaryl-CoA dehydratase subunit BcrC/BadD/HgdB
MIITPSLTNFNKNLVEAVGIEEVINQDLMKSNPHQMNRIREIVVVEETEVHNVEKEGHVVVIIFNAMTKKTHIVVEVEAVTISEMKIEKTLKRSVKVRKKKIRIHGFINSTIKNVQNMTRLM